MGFSLFSKLAGIFSSNDSTDNNDLVEDVEPCVALPAYKAEDDHFLNGVKRISRFQACCYDGGLQKSCLESVWTYSKSGYLTEFTSYTSSGKVFEHYIFEYNKLNNLTKVFINDNLITEHVYDESGINNIKDISYFEDGAIEQIWKGTYNSQNQLISGVTQVYDYSCCPNNPIARVQSRSQNKYDDKGNLISTHLTYDDDPSMNSRMQMKYDNYGRQTEIAEFGPEDNAVRKNCFDRNAEGLVTLECLFDADGLLVEKYESKYDAIGNLTEWTRSSPDGIVTISSNSSYKYDDKNNYTEQINFENGIFDSAFIHEVEYYD